MLNIITVLVLCVSAPIFLVGASAVKTEQVSHQFNQEKIESLRLNLEKGEYSEFLKRMDEAYKNADLEGLIEMRKVVLSDEFLKSWTEGSLASYDALKEKRDAQLLALISEDDGSEIASLIRSVCANLSTPEQQKAMNQISSLMTKAPGTGANADENRLIEIDLEYEYKQFHAQLPQSDVSPEQRYQHQLVLQMEKMNKMVEASKSLQDLSLKQAVGIAAAALDASLANMLDHKALNAIAEGKPSSEMEEKIALILSSYKSELSDLTKQHLENVK